MEKLFFSDVERQAREARMRYMAARGPHGGEQNETKTIKVAGNPGSDLGTGENKEGE